jgi:hypothetical protein
MTKTPARLLERLRFAPTGRAGEVETRTRRAIVLRLTRTLATQRMAGVAVTQGRPAGPERAALDGKPTKPQSLGGYSAGVGSSLRATELMQ